jgi:hypothetical protein
MNGEVSLSTGRFTFDALLGAVGRDLTCARPGAELASQGHVLRVISLIA